MEKFSFYHSTLAVVSLVFMLGFAVPANALDPAEGLFVGVKALNVSAQDKTGTDQVADYQGIRRILDLIVEEYPSSDLAVGILLQETIDGVDIAAIDAALEAFDAQNKANSIELETEVRVETTPMASSPPNSTMPIEDAVSDDESNSSNSSDTIQLSATDVSSEKVLNLDRLAVRDIQARLTVLGHDPNGIDGVLGRGTRAALGQWQETRGLIQSGYLNKEQLKILKEESQAGLDAWLTDRRNAQLYAPPQQRATTQRGLRNGWYMRDGKFCKRVQFGLQYCTPRRPSDA